MTIRKLDGATASSTQPSPSAAPTSAPAARPALSVVPKPVDAPQTTRTGDALEPKHNDFLEKYVLGKISPLFSGFWTNWDESWKPIAILKLVRMRRLLNKFNTRGDQGPPTIKIPAWDASFDKARTADGTWNDLKQPGMGAAGTRFSRAVSMEARFANEKLMMTPDPREVSRVFDTRDKFQPVPFLNLMAASWIQFMVHDWFDHGVGEPVDFFKIKLAEDDPIRKRTGRRYMYIKRTVEDQTRTASEKDAPPTYTNNVTHWWDGSQMYGSDLETQKRLRTFEGGKLKIEKDGLLPRDAKGVEDTGFNTNWWVGLSMLHTLFAKEHNAVCDALKKAHPEMGDQELFDKSRLVVSALLAKIHTVEWTPAILPNPTLKTGMNANWYGLVTGKKTVGFLDKLKKILPSEIGAALFGIVGGPRNLHGAPFSMPEEFVSVYRMHNLLPDAFDVVPLGKKDKTETIGLPDTRDDKSRGIMERVGMTDLFHSFGVQHPGALVNNNYPKFMQEIDIPLVGTTDLASIDILRDRERGVPRYNEFRRQLQLKPITRFSDLTSDPKVIADLERVYKGDVELLDLRIGAQTEAKRPEHFGFGETLFQLFILVASRRLQGDRFFTDSYNAETYTQTGLDWIDDNTMKSVILRHMPELAKTELGNVDNAFNPWKPKAPAEGGSDK